MIKAFVEKNSLGRQQGRDAHWSLGAGILRLLKDLSAGATLFAGVQAVRPYAVVSNEADVWDEPGA